MYDGSLIACGDVINGPGKIFFLDGEYTETSSIDVTKIFNDTFDPEEEEPVKIVRMYGLALYENRALVAVGHWLDPALGKEGTAWGIIFLLDLETDEYKCYLNKPA
jgi:hypothetical protein